VAVILDGLDHSGRSDASRPFGDGDVMCGTTSPARKPVPWMSALSRLSRICRGTKTVCGCERMGMSLRHLMSPTTEMTGTIGQQIAAMRTWPEGDGIAGAKRPHHIVGG